jgi:hypothetical protein
VSGSHGGEFQDNCLATNEVLLKSQEQQARSDFLFTFIVFWAAFLVYSNI